MQTTSTFRNLLLGFFLFSYGNHAYGELNIGIQGLEQYLVTQESKYDDIVPNTEKSIVWSNGEKKQTEYAIVYLHGYSASRQETAPLTEELATSLSANAFMTRLTGHGRGGDAMTEGTVKRWYQDAQEAYDIGKILGKKVILISVSTGSTLATWLAAQEDNQALLASVMVSPNFALPDPNSYLLDLPFRIGIMMGEKQVGDTYSWEPHNELQGRYWTHTYPLRALRELVRLVKLVDEIDKSQIETPLMVIYSPKDQVVSVDAIETTFDEFGSDYKRLLPFKDSDAPSQHVLAGDILSPKSTQPIIEEIKKFLSPLM